MNHKPTCHFSGALSDLASSVQKSHENDPTTNSYFLTISLPLQKLDPLCLWFLGNGRSGRWSLTELGVGAELASKSTRARALQGAPQPPHLGYNGYKQGLSWESSSRLELSDSKDRASRATRPIYKRLINMSDFLYQASWLQPCQETADVEGNWGKGVLLSL